MAPALRAASGDDPRASGDGTIVLGAPSLRVPGLLVPSAFGSTDARALPGTLEGRAPLLAQTWRSAGWASKLVLLRALPLLTRVPFAPIDADSRP